MGSRIGEVPGMSGAALDTNDWRTRDVLRLCFLLAREVCIYGHPYMVRVHASLCVKHVVSASQPRPNSDVKFAHVGSVVLSEPILYSTAVTPTAEGAAPTSPVAIDESISM